MKFLIAGLGSIGRRHFRNFIALGEKDIVLLHTRKATLPDNELAGHPAETDLQETKNEARRLFGEKYFSLRYEDLLARSFGEMLIKSGFKNSTNW